MRRRSGALTAAALFAAVAAMLPAGPAAAGCGPAWQTFPAPRLRNFAILFAVDVHGEGAWAAGQQVRSDLSENRPVAGKFDGARWSISPLAVPGTSGAGLSGISVIGPDDVWAVGAAFSSQGRLRPLALHWDGSSWRTFLPPAAGQYSLLDGVDAVSATDVWAVGFTQETGSTPGDPFVEHWDGIAWRIAPVPSTFRSEELSAVKAFASDDVWAVGSAYPNTGVNRRTLAMHWDGVSWSHVPTPNPRPEQNQVLSDVDGVSGTDVWAVGDYSQQHPLALHWDGASWSAVDVPGEGRLLGVAAAASGDVRAVGGTVEFASGRTLVERWDGSSWSVQDPPPARAPESALGDVAVDGGVFWAVGTQSNESRAAPFIARSCVV